MRRAGLIAWVVAVAVLGGPLWGCGSGEPAEDTYAEGAQVAGLDLAGLTRSEAEELVSNEREPVRELTVREQSSGETWVLDLKDVGLSAHSQRSALRRALDRAQISERSEEGLAEPDRSDLREWISRRAERFDRAARDASIWVSGGELVREASHSGRRLPQQELLRALSRRLSSAELWEGSSLGVRSVKVPPQVRSAELAEEYPRYVVVDIDARELRLYEGLKLSQSYPVAVGAPGYETPRGSFSVQSMQVDPVWSVPNSPWAGELAGTTVAGGVAENPLRERWIGVVGSVGIHGTSEIGSLGGAASHGCVRMSPEDVIDLYDRIQLGDPVELY